MNGDQGSVENTLGFGEEENDKGGNKRIKEMEIDLFTELPDSLVVQILTFLNLKEAAVTSVLSKRWEFLWTELPNLQLRNHCFDLEKMRKFVSWVNRTLSIRNMNYLEKFDVSCVYYKTFTSDVEAWVQFAVENKVKKLSLHLFCVEVLYEPPQAMYCCSSLTTLSVIGCILDSEKKIEWQSLTNLHLNLVFVEEHLLDEILSSCPLLHTLILESCRGFDRVEVNSPIVHSLKIVPSEYEKDAPSLKISAPYIYSLDVLLPEVGRKIQLLDENFKSVVRADIDFQGLPWVSNGLDLMHDAELFLESVKHVKELYVGLHFLQIISLIRLTGRMLPQSKRELLVVTADHVECHKCTIFGIIVLLESSPNLETLVIKGCAPQGNYAIQDPTEGRDLKCDLSRLKTISIVNFADPNGELMLALARTLLKRATHLENMDVVVDVAENSDFLRINEELQLCPRASIKAQVVIKKHAVSSR